MNPQFNDLERECIVLKAAWEALRSMVNRALLKFYQGDSESEVRFNSRESQQIFNILLLDFLNTKIWPFDSQCLSALVTICNKPQINSDSAQLLASVTELNNFLNQEVKIEYQGDKKTFWFPSIDKEVSLKIRRGEFIKICGNISKHNTLGLDKQAEILQKIFSRSEIELEITDALLTMEEFYKHFHDDLFNYHANTIVELLNNLCWTIYEYTKPLYEKSIEYYSHPIDKHAYRYKYPTDISHKYARAIFWDLMNSIRSGPIFPRFEVSRYFKMRY